MSYNFSFYHKVDSTMVSRKQDFHKSTNLRLLLHTRKMDVKMLGL